jgi:hypothetical protein
MSSPVSTSASLGSQLILVEDALEGAVLCGVVRGVGLPALPDHIQPGAGEDADGVGMVVSPGSGLAVKVGGPRVGLPGAGSEVADGRHPHVGVRTRRPVRSLFGARGAQPCRRFARPGHRQPPQHSSWT